HIEAGHIPDQSWVVWEYERSGKQVPTVSNPEKFYQAAKACFRKLVLAAGKHGLSPKPWEEIGDRVKRCLAKRPDCEDQDDNKSLTRNKCEHWESEFGDLFFDDGGEHLCYDRLAFRRTAFENSPDELDWDEWDRGWTLGRTFAVRREFFESDWVKFHRAALIQRALFEHLKMQNRS
ncbi:MAG: hypothetical protein JW941_06180, partial [Candidatus Coatesbacteria bacterium]|nr:hypothetical protein [Candidatus Coatesbacteria bacterium]